MSKSKPVSKGITIDWSKLLGFDQLSQSSGSQRTQLQSVSLLTKVGSTKMPAPKDSR